MNGKQHPDGSELHRLKEMQNYDPEEFNHLYKVCVPVIRNLVNQIDCKRLGLSKDIVSSYFWDKMLFVFNRYQGELDDEGNKYSEEHLKALILRALSTYKNKLLRFAYGERAEILKGMASFEDLFDDSKEDYADEASQEEEVKEEQLNMLYKYMNKHLSPDAQLVFEILMTPPPYITSRMKGTRITSLLIAQFFNMPMNRNSVRYIGELREDIQYWEDKAKEELHY